MNRGLFTALLVAVMGMGCDLTAQTPTAHPATAASRHSQGFIEYALSRINPGDNNFGTSVSDARASVVTYTIHDLYFYSNMVSILLLAGTSTALVLVLRTQEKRDIIAATLIAQLWNGRVVDRREIHRRTERYNVLVDAKNHALACGPSSQAEEEVTAEVPQSREEGNRSKKGRGQSEKGTALVGETGLLPFDDVAQRARLLEGQNQALRNSERNLRDRLNQVTGELQQEKRRNQTLKGA